MGTELTLRYSAIHHSVCVAFFISAVLLTILSPAHAVLNHRYDFSNPAGSASGAVIVDSQGSADGVVLGSGAVFTGTALDLPGGSSATAAYVDLPNGLISTETAVSLECWLTLDSTASTWMRVFDFGSGTAGEIFGPGGSAAGTNYLLLAPCVNGNYYRNGLDLYISGDGSGSLDRSVKDPLTGESVHYVVTVENDGSGGSTINYWRNGKNLVQNAPGGSELSDVSDVNNWLGRSNWTADDNTDGKYDEFRIYNHAMSDFEVQVSRLLGPDDTSGDPGLLTSQSVVADDTVVVDGVKKLEMELTFSDLGAPVRIQSDPVLLTWSSSDTNILIVSQTGEMTGVSTGTVTVSGSWDGSPGVKSVTVTPRQLSHRYSFNGPSDTLFAILEPDLVGAADAWIYYAALRNGIGQVELWDALSGYIDFPNGIISTMGSGTFEAWVTLTDQGRGWERIFSFGTTTFPGGENDAYQISGYEADECIEVIARMGLTPNLAFRREGVDSLDINADLGYTLNEQIHVVAVYNSATAEAILYQNGMEVGRTTNIPPLYTLPDLNVWAGRSAYDTDGYWDGSMDEVRFYEGALTPMEIAVNSATGPNADPFTVLGPLQSLGIYIPSATMNVYDTMQIILQANYENVSGVPLNTIGEIEWSADNPDVAAVDSKGIITALGVGTVNVSLSYQGTTSSIPITVFNPNPVTLRHHWTFDETAGTTVADIVGGADGTVIGTNFTWTGEAIDLFGGGTSSAYGNPPTNSTAAGAYVDLPNGIISSAAAAGMNTVTFDVTYMLDSETPWQRIFDFGIDASHLENAVGTGAENIFLTPYAGNGANAIRATVATQAPGYSYETQWTDSDPAVTGVPTHVIFTYDSAGGNARLFVNGEQVASGTSVYDLSSLAGLDLNNWLGRAQYGGDPMLDGRIADFRIYTGILTPIEIRQRYAGEPLALIVRNTNNSGPGSLRDTIATAPFGSTIHFDPSLAGQTITLTSGELLVNKNLSIDASPIGGITIDGNATFRIFHVVGNTTTLSGLTLANGYSINDYSDLWQENGAVYLEEGILNIADCSFHDNQADYGGAIFNYYGILAINNSVFSENSAIWNAGAVFNWGGTMAISNSTFTGNSANWAGALASFTDNISTTPIHSRTTVNQCTFAENLAYTACGAIYNGSGWMFISNSTIVANTSLDSAGEWPDGSGLYSYGDDYTETVIANTIISGNSGGNDLGLRYLLNPDAFLSQGHNLIGSGTVSYFTAPGDTTNHTLSSIKLAPLNDYGGPTQTMPPLPGSPALDAGGATSFTTDQRGMPRVLSAGYGPPVVDIGAVEYNGWLAGQDMTGMDPACVLPGSIYDSTTVFPEGYDPDGAGMLKILSPAEQQDLVVQGEANVTGDPETYGLYTESALRVLALDRPFITQNPSNGMFRVTVGLLHAPDLFTAFTSLTNFTVYPYPEYGEVDIEFAPPSPDVHFFELYGAEPGPGDGL